MGLVYVPTFGLNVDRCRQIYHIYIDMDPMGTGSLRTATKINHPGQRPQDAQTQIHEAGEILRRLRSEQVQIRSQTLSVLCLQNKTTHWNLGNYTPED